VLKYVATCTGHGIKAFAAWMGNRRSIFLARPAVQPRTVENEVTGNVFANDQINHQLISPQKKTVDRPAYGFPAAGLPAAFPIFIPRREIAVNADAAASLTDILTRWKAKGRSARSAIQSDSVAFSA
jgi:hypothetical protein